MTQEHLGLIGHSYYEQVNDNSTNNDSIVHTWQDDLKTTLCGLPEEIVWLPSRYGPVRLCEVCHHIFAGWEQKLTPTPAEAALLEVLFPNA